MPIHFINGKCHIKKLKSRKICETCLTNHTQSISHHITPLVINALGQTYTHAHMPTHEPKQFQETRCIPGLKTYWKTQTFDGENFDKLIEGFPHTHKIIH